MQTATSIEIPDQSHLNQSSQQEQTDINVCFGADNIIVKYYLELKKGNSVIRFLENASMVFSSKYYVTGFLWFISVQLFIFLIHSTNRTLMLNNDRFSETFLQYLFVFFMSFVHLGVEEQIKAKWQEPEILLHFSVCSSKQLPTYTSSKHWTTLAFSWSRGFVHLMKCNMHPPGITRFLP